MDTHPLNRYDMDSDLSTSAYYSEGDSITSSSQEETSKDDTTGCNPSRRLYNRKPRNNTIEGAAYRTGADTSTMTKDPTEVIVQKILNKIQLGLDEVSPKLGEHWRTKTTPKDAAGTAGPCTEDEQTSPTRQAYAVIKEEKALETSQPQHQCSQANGYCALGPRYLYQYDVVMVNMPRRPLEDAVRGVIVRCLPDDRYLVNIGTDNYTKHRNQLMPLTRKLIHDKRAMANYRPKKSVTMPKVSKTRPKRTPVDQELDEKWHMLRIREGNRNRHSGATTIPQPTCQGMWHKVGPHSKRMTSCHKCPHHEGLETIDEEGAQIDTNL